MNRPPARVKVKAMALDRAQTEELARSLKIYALENPTAYGLRVILLGLLGYAYVLGFIHLGSRTYRSIWSTFVTAS